MKKAEEIFIRFTCKVNKDYPDYTIKDRQGFINAIEEYGLHNQLLYEHERKRSEKMKELIDLLKWMAKDITPYYAKFTKLKSDLSAIEAESGEEEDKQEVYEFIYNPMIHESASATMSIHATLKGAEMAMEFHKAEALKEHNESAKERKESGDDFDYGEFGQMEHWGIRKTTIKQ